MKRILMLIAVFGAADFAQTPADVIPGIGQKMKENAAALQQYSHKRRTEVEVKGQSKGARVELVRYINGKIETTPLEAPQHTPGAGRGRGLRGLIASKKKEDMKEDVEKLTSLMRQYTSPGSDSLRTALAKAAISRSGPEPQADIVAVAKGIVKPSDSITFTWSVVHHRPEKIEVSTDVDGNPISATVEYTSLPEGLFYAAHTIVSEPKKHLTISIANFDYTHGDER